MGYSPRVYTSPTLAATPFPRILRSRRDNLLAVGWTCLYFNEVLSGLYLLLIVFTVLLFCYVLSTHLHVQLVGIEWRPFVLPVFELFY